MWRTLSKVEESNLSYSTNGLKNQSSSIERSLIKFMWLTITITRLGCFYVTATMSWGKGWGWVEVDIEAEVNLRLRLKWGWVEV